MKLEFIMTINKKIEAKIDKNRNTDKNKDINKVKYDCKNQDIKIQDKRKETDQEIFKDKKRKDIDKDRYRDKRINREKN